ncbi:MAG TPA: terminase family protein [Bacteroidia bacterium]
MKLKTKKAAPKKAVKKKVATSEEVEAIRVELNLNPKQTIAWDVLSDNKITECLFGGGASGGKSFLGVAWLITMCINYPGTRYLMGRAELENLKKTTLKSFFEVCTKWGIKGDGIHYKYNIHEKTITWTNGSEILLYDLAYYPSDPNYDKLGGLELTGAFVDEANEVTKEAKNILTVRLRYKLDEYKIKPKLLMTCNPAKGWVYDEFYKPSLEETIEPHRAFIPALASDNEANNSSNYIEMLERLDDFQKRRFLYGDWDLEDTHALINHDCIQRMFHTLNYTPPEKSTYYLTCDIARLGADKTVLVLWRNLDILKIFTLEKATADLVINKINELVNAYGINRKNIIIDTDGVGGPIADMLKGCVSFVNGSSPLRGENYKNLKTQCYYKLAEVINDDRIKVLSINDEQKKSLIQELEVIRMIDTDKDSKLAIISKDKIKQLISRSPDYSDAIMFRMWYEIQPKSVGYFMRKIR